jgi:hypothetical protein
VEWLEDLGAAVAGAVDVVADVSGWAFDSRRGRV